MAERTFEQALEENFMGEVDLFIGVVDLFSSQYKTNLEKLKNAIDSEERTTVKEVAHKIKGSVSHFHREAPVAIAQVLEHQSSTLSKDLMQAEFAKLESALHALNVELGQISTRLQATSTAA